MKQKTKQAEDHKASKAIVSLCSDFCSLFLCINIANKTNKQRENDDPLSISGNNNGLAVGKYSIVGAFYMSYQRAQRWHLIFLVTLILSMIYTNNF